MKNLVLTFAIILIAVAHVFATNNNGNSAQHNINITINTHALVGLSSSSSTTDLSLYPGDPASAGLGLDFTAASATNSDLWLNYSSIVSDGATNTISAALTGDALPAGLSIELVVSENGTGTGATGTGNTVTLSSGDVVVEDIGNCYTGSDANDGHNLTYTLKWNGSASGASYEALTADEFNTTVTYTITEN